MNKKLKIYLDNCCFNRPFDDQEQTSIHLESEAKLCIQEQVMNNEVELVWSYILDYENYLNPFEERKNMVQKWKDRAVDDIVENDELLSLAEEFFKLGIKSKDSLHISCAIYAKCDLFITTDKSILNKMENNKAIKVINPLDYYK